MNPDLPFYSLITAAEIFILIENVVLFSKWSKLLRNSLGIIGGHFQHQDTFLDNKEWNLIIYQIIVLVISSSNLMQSIRL